MSYAQQLVLARVVAVVIVAVTAIMAGNADLLGITPRIGAWLAIFVGVLGAVGGYLPSIRGMSTDPTFLEHRVSELPAAKRRAFATRMANRAAKDAEARQV